MGLATKSDIVLLTNINYNSKPNILLLSSLFSYLLLLTDS